jgi:hypothetical protein
MNAAKNALESTLRALSLPADAQIAVIPMGRCVPCTLAHLFSWWAREFQEEFLMSAALTEGQRQALQRLDEASQDAARSHQCHDNQAVHSGAAFGALRQVAAAALSEFGCDAGLPDRQYIPGTAEHAARCEQAERERKQLQRAARRPSKARLKFHQATFTALGATPAISRRNVQLLRKRERTLGVRFPQAVFELFSIEGIADLFREHSNADELVTNDEFDVWKKLALLGIPSEISQGYLRVAVENQGVVAFYVPLDGSEDPPVLHNNDQWIDDLSAVAWVTVADSFSGFIRAMMGDED